MIKFKLNHLAGVSGYTTQDRVAWLHERDFEVQRIEDDCGLVTSDVDHLTSFQNILASCRP